MSREVGLPLVSVGCAVYNGEATLARALQPLVEQDYPNIELIIADDCSTDRSFDICEDYARRYPCVRLTRHARNLGLSQNLNFVFREARGKYFMWADQDDIRDRTFIRKAVAALEANPAAVLCHAHTAGFIGDPADIKYVLTLDRVSGVRSPLRRYVRFLRHYADTTLYGLIRAEALADTTLWRDTVASANALAFQLLLRGPFIEVPEVLYFYCGRGLRYRPSPQEEYARVSNGRRMPWYYFPFLLLARNQTLDILRSPAPLLSKPALVGAVWLHVAIVNGTKAVYRLLARASGGRVPDAVTRLCDWIVDARPHLTFVGDAGDDETLFPRSWALKGQSQRMRSPS